MPYVCNFVVGYRGYFVLFVVTVKKQVQGPGGQLEVAGMVVGEWAGSDGRRPKRYVNIFTANDIFVGILFRHLIAFDGRATGLYRIRQFPGLMCMPF